MFTGVPWMCKGSPMKTIMPKNTEWLHMEWMGIDSHLYGLYWGHLMGLWIIDDHEWVVTKVPWRGKANF